ncbi:TrkH family potassium uptake protein [Streptosporangium sp. NBC_01756]|uniref:TrkH family potassium uptake protein n=1 Tax=Streptosporangium sp. NBC_01756 TaxID=2975950 RepID=UPI002DDB61BD|nr:potassium transporter TrkG [Streptosporangium sp. NBC_01756]WSC89581.1 TrkH family potassium uptake protein [Streptosporangium sp. NBC_01756]
MIRRPVSRTLLERFQHPAQIIVTAFAAAAAVGTGLLDTPWAAESGVETRLIDALFTAVSAVCVTGLVTVDTASHWSAFGEVVIMVLIQIGGLGIMTLATLFAMMISGRIGLRARMWAQAETKAPHLSDLRRVIGNVVLFTLACEALVAVALAARFAIGYGESPGRAAYLGLFHAISAFNNAGFGLWPDNLMRFSTDVWVCLPIVAAVIVGGLGYPVIFELRRSWRRPERWSMLTRITVTTTLVLLVAGFAVFTITEWANPKTLGPMGVGGKLLAGFFTGVMPRTAGFNSLDIAAMYPTSWLATDVLMFIGGGSAGTAGGIKVTTFAVLAYVLWAELRGETHVNAGHRRLAATVQRQALAIALLGLGLVIIATYALLALTPHGLDKVLFEVVSAVATVGLSTGITADLTAAGQLIITVLMFAGRVGPATLFSALALRDRTRRYELPEEKIIVG